MGFLDLENAYDKVNREALWQVLRMYYVSGKLLNGIKSMYVKSIACVRVKGVIVSVSGSVVVRDRGVPFPFGFSTNKWMQ